MDFGADNAAARERIGASSASAPLAAAPLAVALDVTAKPKPLASAPLEVSFRRWDEGAGVAALAEELGRGAGGIEARLVRLGLVPDRETARTRP